jgi:hypothetical protein
MKPPMTPEQELEIGAALEMFTIYRHPSDYPDKFVVRRFLVTDKPNPDKTPCAVCNNLNDARAAIPFGMVCVDRQPSDDPVIIETWL